MPTLISRIGVGLRRLSVVGPLRKGAGSVRGARGVMALGMRGGAGVSNVVRDESLKFTEGTQMKQIVERQGWTYYQYDLVDSPFVYQNLK